jgi:hypothetical protein
MMGVVLGPYGDWGATAAAAADIDWTDVDLGTHRFDHLTKPDAIVAQAGPDEVGFEQPEEGPGDGPWSFDVTPDGTVWMLDQIGQQILVWDPGQPDAPARSVPLPQEEMATAADMAVGVDGTAYLSYLPLNPPDDSENLRVAAVSSTGEVLWTEATDISVLNSRLRTAPDGSIYWEGTTEIDGKDTSGLWTPLTTPDGEALSIDEQRAGSSAYQPMPGDLRFEAVELGEEGSYEWDFTLLDETDQVVGAWRITSGDELGGTIDEPGMVDGDPIVVLGVARQTDDEYLYEFVALRLPVGGGDVDQISLDPHAVFGDIDVADGLRVGPDGALYELRSDIETGASVARYSIGALSTPSPSPSPSPSSTPSSPASPTSSATTPSASPSALPTSPAVPTLASEPESGSSAVWVVVGVLLVAALAGAGSWFVYRSRRGSEG